MLYTVRTGGIRLIGMMVLLLGILAVPMEAQTVKTCGVYRIIGKLVEKDGQYRLVVKEGTNSETNVYVGFIEEEFEEYGGEKVEALVFIMEKGMFIFRADLIEIIDVIDILDVNDEYRSDWELVEERDCIF